MGDDLRVEVSRADVLAAERAQPDEREAAQASTDRVVCEAPESCRTRSGHRETVRRSRRCSCGRPTPRDRSTPGPCPRSPGHPRRPPRGAPAGESRDRESRALSSSRGTQSGRSESSGRDPHAATRRRLPTRSVTILEASSSIRLGASAGMTYVTCTWRNEESRPLACGRRRPAVPRRTSPPLQPTTRGLRRSFQADRVGERAEAFARTRCSAGEDERCQQREKRYTPFHRRRHTARTPTAVRIGCGDDRWMTAERILGFVLG